MRKHQHSVYNGVVFRKMNLRGKSYCAVVCVCAHPLRIGTSGYDEKVIACEADRGRLALMASSLCSGKGRQFTAVQHEGSGEWVARCTVERAGVDDRGPYNSQAGADAAIHEFENPAAETYAAVQLTEGVHRGRWVVQVRVADLPRFTRGRYTRREHAEAGIEEWRQLRSRAHARALACAHRSPLSAVPQLNFHPSTYVDELVRAPPDVPGIVTTLGTFCACSVWYQLSLADSLRVSKYTVCLVTTVNTIRGDVRLARVSTDRLSFACAEGAPSNDAISCPCGDPRPALQPGAPCRHHGARAPRAGAHAEVPISVTTFLAH